MNIVCLLRTIVRNLCTLTLLHCYINVRMYRTIVRILWTIYD